MKKGVYFCFFALIFTVYAKAQPSSIPSDPSHLTEKPGDITLLPTYYKQINFLLEKALGKDLLHRQLNLHKLRELAAAGKEVRNRIRFTLKKDVYNLLPADIENLKMLYQAINASSPLFNKSVFQSTAKDFPPSLKDSLDKALKNVLSFAPLVVKVLPRSVPETLPPAGAEPSLNMDILMQPLIEEKNSFNVELGSSNQLTPMSVCLVDLTFFQQTGGAETAVERNKGTLKLLLLAKAQILGNKKIKTLSRKQRDLLAENLFQQETGGTAILNNEKIYHIYDQVRQQILKKVSPQLNCPLIRQHLGMK